MTENIKKMIKDLSGIYDNDSKDTFVSLYANKKSFRKFLDRRKKICISILKGEELKNFNNTLDDIQEIFKDFSTNNIAVFASHKNNFLNHCQTFHQN